MAVRKSGKGAGGAQLGFLKIQREKGGGRQTPSFLHARLKLFRLFRGEISVALSELMFQHPFIDHLNSI